jgi:hypothetical protein
MRQGQNEGGNIRDCRAIHYIQEPALPSFIMERGLENRLELQKGLNLSFCATRPRRENQHQNPIQRQASSELPRIHPVITRPIHLVPSPAASDHNQRDARSMIQPVTVTVNKFDGNYVASILTFRATPT